MAVRSIAVTVLIGLSLLAADQAAAAKTKPLIVLERTACYGECPIYTVSIWPDGRILWEGRKFVRHTGRAEAVMPREAVEQLVGKFCDIKFFELEDEYISKKTQRVVNGRTEELITVSMDRPTIYVTFNFNGKSKTVTDYFGGPPELRQLEWAVDHAANTQRWIFVDAETMGRLLRHGFDVKKRGSSYLSDAIFWGDLSVAQQLLQAGVPPHCKGRTNPMFDAATGRNSQMIPLFVQFGADVNCKDESRGTPVMRAAHYGLAENVAALVEHGANVDAMDEYGETALMKAADFGDPETVQILINAGADPKLRNRAGETALRLAEAAELRQRQSLERDGPDPDEANKEYGRVIQMLRSQTD